MVRLNRIDRGTEGRIWLTAENFDVWVWNPGNLKGLGGDEMTFELGTIMFKLKGPWCSNPDARIDDLSARDKETRQTKGKAVGA